MDIDRSRFLFLTASLAAAACNQPRPATTPDSSGAGSNSSDPANPSVWLEIEPGTEDKAKDPLGADCDNRAGRPSTCSLAAPGSHCESFDSTLRLCHSFTDFMQPRAAEAAIDCMLAASGTQRICDWEIWAQCTSAGLQATCVEPRTRDSCDTISSSCGGGVDLFSCQQALSAVQPHHMSRLATCVQEFCEIPFCVTDLGSY